MGVNICRDSKGRIIQTAADVMIMILELGDDFDDEMLPPLKMKGSRTKEAQALVDHLHSGKYKPGDELYDDISEMHGRIADFKCRVAAGLVYEHFVETKEEGVAR